MSTVTGPGIFDGLDERAYHADPVRESSLSVTGAKRILDCPARFAWERDHRKEKRVFDFGHAAHAKVLGVGLGVEIVLTTAKDGAKSEARDRRTKSAQDHEDDIRARGLVPLIRSEMDTVDAMAAALIGHPLAARLFRDGTSELSMFWRDEATKVMLRGRIDWLTTLGSDRPVVVDYKTIAGTADPDRFGWEAGKYGYHMQDCWYREGYGVLTGTDPAFTFVVQEKSPPYLVSVCELDDDAREVGAQRNRVARATYLDCMTRDEWPGYAPVVHPVSIPRARYAPEYEETEL